MTWIEEIVSKRTHEDGTITEKEINLDDYINKYKIKAKIKELEDNMILFTNDKEKFYKYKYARDILEKLLKGNE